MSRHFYLTVLFILLPLVSPQSQTHTASRAPLDSAEVTEATNLAAKAAELYTLGKYKEALPPAKRCLQIREKLFTPADEALRIALRNLAEIYIALRKYEDAEPLFHRLIKSYEEFAPADSRLVTALQRMALLKFVSGAHDKTEELYRRALEITEKAHGPADPSAATAAFYLAEFYQAVGNFKNAEPLYQRVFAIREKQTPTGDSEDFRQALDRYSCLLQKTGRQEQARMLEDRSSSSARGPAPVTGLVSNGRAIRMPKPPYPDEARAARVSGNVLVRVVIDETGRVIRACAMEGPPLLMRVSETAAYSAVFTPTRVNDQPVKVTGQINYNFVAQ
jgi:tetratricopeptide (TPR) repeat protein